MALTMDELNAEFEERCNEIKNDDYGMYDYPDMVVESRLEDVRVWYAAMCREMEEEE